MGEGYILLNRSAFSRIGCPAGKSKLQGNQRCEGGFLDIASIHLWHSVHVRRLSPWWNHWKSEKYSFGFVSLQRMHHFNLAGSLV